MTDSLAKRLMRDLLGAPAVPGPELIVEEGPAIGQRLSLPGPGARVVVGRGEGAGWVVLDPDLSRAHAAFDHRADGVYVCDLDSKNGTRVDGVAAPTQAPGVRIADGARITLGKTTLRFRVPIATGASTLTHAGSPPVPPRWPILVALALAVAALGVAAFLYAS